MGTLRDAIMKPRPLLLSIALGVLFANATACVRSRCCEREPSAPIAAASHSEPEPATVPAPQPATRPGDIEVARLLELLRESGSTDEDPTVRFLEALDTSHAAPPPRHSTSIAGHVLDPDGKPVAGATIEVRRDNEIR